MPQAKKIDWKDTINLPQTDFTMKAQLNQKEPQIMKKWDEENIYQKILESRSACPLYILHDGPPYANGNIHLGTALNKILKDFVVKSKTMEGFQAPYLPGWDCHGLPIEHRVDQELGERKKQMTLIQVRQACRRYAEKYIGLQRADFQRLGIFGQWRDPYTTFDPQYEAAIIRFFNSFVRRGNVYRKKKPVHWCASCQTALAEAEVEYRNHTSPSITVKFPLLDYPAVLESWRGQPVSVLIWTTTPWTIPANLAIAVHPEYDYALFRLNGELHIAASRLLPLIAERVGGRYEKLAEFKGAELRGLRARHPLYDRPSLLINTHYVLLDQGTGCVHTAPGHGEEDYRAGIEFNLDIYSPVDATGHFDASTGPYAGAFVFAANETIAADLRRQGRLLHGDTIEHSYPHCWRCKNPVIYRATEQWFIAMDTADLRRKTLEAIKGVQWIPAWGEERITTMIANRPDWCISRQRDWGIPLPVFFCNECSQPLLRSDIVELVAEVFARHGSNAWYERDISEFLPQDAACGECGGKAFTKGQDILDVWFESGSSQNILERYPRHRWPADMYLEGGDQYRGWFHSSLLIGISAKEASPYKTVLTHGWMLDDQGRAMSKSLGNTIEPQSVIRETGADILRLWVAMVNYQEDVRFGKEILARVVESYRKIRNTWRFMLGVLADFDPQHDPSESPPFSELDLYILQKFQQVKEKALQAYRNYEYYTVYHTLFNFFTVDLSAFYLNVQKDNLYCNLPAAPARRTAQAVVFKLLVESLQLLAPVLSFTCEEAWQFVPAFRGKEGSVHLCRFPAGEPRFRQAVDEATWERLLALRDRALKEIEEARNRKLIGDSLEAELHIGAPGADLALLRQHRDLLQAMLVVSGLRLEESAVETIRVAKAEGHKCPRCWNWFTGKTAKGKHPELCPRCRQVAKELRLEPRG